MARVIALQAFLLSLLLGIPGGDALLRNNSSPVGLTAKETMHFMGRGINLGNVYDFDSGNDRSLEASLKMIDLFVHKGFRHVRIPVTWGQTFNESSELTQTVTKVVHHALNKNLYVILNTHHEHWLKLHYNNTAYFNDLFTNLWTGIATHFQKAGSRLIFEILNEPDGVLGGWLPGQASPFHAKPLALTRAINEVGYRAVRAVTPHRVILVMPNGMGSRSLINHVYPNPSFLPGEGADEYLGATVHIYDPWEFGGETGHNSHFETAERMQNFLREAYASVENWYYSSLIPLHVGEYGLGRLPATASERDTDLVRAYYKYAANAFALNGWPSTVWDDQGWFAIVKDFKFVHGLADAVLSTY